MIRVGRVLTSQDKNGELRLRFDEPAGIDFSRLKILSIGREGDIKGFRVESLVVRGKTCRVKLEGVDRRAEADALVGQDVYLAKEDFKPLEDGCYYMFQLVGCLVLEVRGEKIGRVVDVMSAGEAEILVVDREGKEVLIPFHASICPRVDIAAGEIEVDLPDGLLDIDEI